ncbi:MAG: 23S rRNA (adenine(2503)-C(2))-methyltransferase RlmN [Desulfobacteraceae bacterium]|nr:MAG: 23S rRNA (adenine(2503)-C(2))-methyltransferase RlmN [Desulfobacteraceae bacterium]
MKGIDPGDHFSMAGDKESGLQVFALTCEEVAEEMSSRYGKGLYHAAALYRAIFKKGGCSFAGTAEFSRSPSLVDRLVRDLRLPACRVVATQEDEGVLKFTSALADDRVIESVIIPAQGRTTLCVSSQVGCRMGCRFCTTGGMGYVRDLNVEEIVWQVYAARFEMNRPVDNVVFMGMGEPLDNLENLAGAVRVMGDQRGLDIPPSHITVSTAGHADGIRKLGEMRIPRIRLAVSLNASNDELRTSIMPINKRYPLRRLKQELLAFPRAKDGVIFIEYVLLKGINDLREDAEELAGYLNGLPVRVNVIPYNPSGVNSYAAPSREDVQRFCGWLVEERLFVRPRRSRGQDIMAACGQLGAAARAEERPLR